MRKRGGLFIVGSVLVLAATACDQECSRMETLRTDAFAAEAWGVSQWLSVKNSAVFMGGVADGTRAADGQRAGNCPCGSKRRTGCELSATLNDDAESC